MPTLVRDPQPVEFEALLERRGRLGQDLFDEVWEGVYYVNPAPHSRHGRTARQVAVIVEPLAQAAGLVGTDPFNLGEADDYRVPDGGWLRPGPDQVYLPTAALVLEVVSPNDDTWEKLGFYARHHVDELLIVDPQERRVHWLGLDAVGECRPVDRSGLVALGPTELAGRIIWPD